MTPSRRTVLAGILAGSALAAGPRAARAAEAAVIEARVNLALQQLFAQVPGSRELAAEAKGVLVMPSVVKGGFILGGAYGEGALRLPQGDGTLATAGYYSVAAASIGLQAGVQETGHALFFLTDAALAQFRQADGWTLGADAELTVPDRGMNVGITSAEYRKPVVALAFGEDGLLLGASLSGAKYSPIAR